MCFRKLKNQFIDNRDLSLWLLLIIIFILLLINLGCCNFSLGTNHALTTLAALFAIIIIGQLFSFSSKIAITLTISILFILIGFIFYNPITNTIPIKFLSVSDYCKLQFYENFQNEMNGICVLCDKKPLDKKKFLQLFPKSWLINENQYDMLKKIRSDPNLFNLVCAPDFPSLLCQLNKIKTQNLLDIDTALKNINDENIKKIKEEITKIILLDQAILFASAQTINSCHCNGQCSACAPHRNDSIQKMNFSMNMSIDESTSGKGETKQENE